MQTLLRHYLTEYNKIKNTANTFDGTFLEQREQAIKRFTAEGFSDLTKESWRYLGRSLLLKKLFYFPSIKSTHYHADHLPKKSEISALRFVFVNGRFSDALSSSLDTLPAGLKVTTVAKTGTNATSLINTQSQLKTDSQDSFIQLNTAFLQDGLIVTIDDNHNIQPLIELLFIHEPIDAVPVMMPVRNVFQIGSNSQVRFIERYWNAKESSSSQDIACCINVISVLSVDKDAVVGWSQVVDVSTKSIYVGQLFVVQQESSQLHTESCFLSGGVARHNVKVELQGKQSACTLNGLSLGRQQNQLEHNIVIQHHAHHTESSVHYRATADDASRVVFGGNVQVAKNVTKIQARQNNHNLLLSKEAEADTKPRLELFADDIMCTHGATIGQLDEAALWYLQTRGIPLKKAHSILIQSFNQVIVNEMKTLRNIPELVESLQNWRT